METKGQISVDLKAVLVEGHRDFSLLSVYKGVPFVSRATLEKAEGESAFFIVQPPEFVTLQRDKIALVLSDGLLEPFEAKILSFDLAAMRFELGDFLYAGSKHANRRELRVEPEYPLKVIVSIPGSQVEGQLADVSIRGVGVRIAAAEAEIFMAGQQVLLNLNIPEGADFEMAGRIRNIARSSVTYRLSIEFLGTVPEKAMIVRYIMRRRADIMAEVQHKHQQIQQTR